MCQIDVKSSSTGVEDIHAGAGKIGTEKVLRTWMAWGLEVRDAGEGRHSHEHRGGASDST